jgi:hypothetical protein
MSRRAVLVGGVLAVLSAVVGAQPTPGAQAPARPDTAGAGVNAAPSARSAGRGRQVMPKEIVLERETFDYVSGGRRDPYASLMTSSDVRPLISDLKLAVIVLDPEGGNNLAVLRDTFTKRQYRVRVGQQLGRLRVAAIRPRAVVFTVEEFGFNRQETLSLSSDTTKTKRNP